MEVILILFLLIVFGLFIYIIFRLVKWILNRRLRMIWALSLIGFLVLAVLTNKLFFEKMEFIQSKVYPDLYLVKNPISDQDSLNKIISLMVLDKLNDGFIGKNKRDSYSQKIIRFYKYTSAWVFQNGTKYFIENREDPGGFSSEELNNYFEHQMAYFSIANCRNESENHLGYLFFFENGSMIRTDTLIHLCESTTDSEVLNLKETISVKGLMNLTKLEAIEKYGAPSFSEQFILDDAQGEFRNGISYKYTIKERQSQTILIDEATWEKDEDTWVTAWYEAQEKTVSKGAFEWNKGTEF